MAEVLNRAKVYIDFGGHPGKDRIPREAAACGCCILTNKEGSAANAEDVKIPEKYKFGETGNTDRILEVIYELVDHYEERTAEFQQYRDKIKGEKAAFEREADRFIELLG